MGTVCDASVHFCVRLSNMSMLEEQSSVNLNECSGSSSIARRLYLSSTRLLSNPSLANADSCSTSGQKSSSADDTSNISANTADLTTYDAEVDKKFVTSADSVPYFCQPILNVPLSATINTLNSTCPNVVTPAAHPVSTANPVNYYDLFTGRSQTQTMSTPIQSLPYYSGQDYSKYPIFPPPSNNLSCLQTYSVGQHTDYTDRSQNGLQTAPPSTRVMDTPYFPTYPSATDGSRFNCASGGIDGHTRYTDPSVNRQARHTFPGYHIPGTDDPVTQPSCTSRAVGSGVELLVSNLDYNIGAKEWRKILFTQLQSTVKNVHSIVIQTQADGSNYAIIKVGSIEDARLAISHFHRKKIGYKRIQVNIVSPNGICGAKGLKSEVVSLLRSVSTNALPVCKFIDLFEKRYHRSISVSDLYKMRDVIEIREQSGSQGGRLITLSVRAQRFDSIEVSLFFSFFSRPRAIFVFT